MTTFHPYEIVLSLAGHDKGHLYFVLSAEEGYCLLADGKGRKLDAPKRKSIKHIRRAGTSACPAIYGLHRGSKPTDRQLREALAAFRDSSSL